MLKHIRSGENLKKEIGSKTLCCLTMSYRYTQAATSALKETHTQSKPIP